MSVEQSDTVDAVGIETVSGKVILTISDHLGWEAEGEHLIALENKINAYLAFVESGELQLAFPPSVGRTPVISIVARLPLSAAGAGFLAKARAVIEPTGIELRHRVFEE